MKIIPHQIVSVTRTFLSMFSSIYVPYLKSPIRKTEALEEPVFSSKVIRT